jgi:protoheme IX farnesyltransferase
MKRISPLAIPIGAFPGALPVLIGAVAIEGEITAFALTLFTIQFFWQFPHFWAIGWLGFDDYKKAGFKLLPSVNGNRDEKTGLQSFIYALVLAVIPILFYWNFNAGWLSIAVMSLTGILYAKYGWNLYKENTNDSARKLMFFSFAYMPIILSVLMLDKFLF